MLGRTSLQLTFVNTSTGGIIALALGEEGLSVTKSIDLFVKLCDQAFELREGMKIPGVDVLTMLAHEGSKYKTTPLTEVLKANFKDQPLFVGKRLQSFTTVKVAVTTTSETMQNATILTNYNRPLPPVGIPQRMA